MIADDWAPSPPSVTVETKEKPVIYLPDGREVTISKPFGFANHPYVPMRKIK